MTQSPNKIELNAGEMPAEVFLQRWRRKPDGADIFGFSFQPEVNEPNTKYIRADLVEKMKDVDGGR